MIIEQCYDVVIENVESRDFSFEICFLLKVNSIRWKEIHVTAIVSLIQTSQNLFSMF